MTVRNYASANPSALGQYLALERSGTVITHDTSCDNQRMALGLYPKSSGVWFFEATLYGEETLSSAGVSIGVANEAASLAECVGDSAASFGYRSDGKLRDSGTDRASVLHMVYDDVIGVLVDAGNRVIWYRNGLYQGEQMLPAGHQWAIAVTVSNATTAYGTKVLLNAGQQKFSYPPPLVTNQGWYDATASFGALRVADRPALLAGKRYHGLVSARQSSLSVTQELSFWPWRDGQPSQGRASLVLDNATGYADTLFAGDPRDATIDMRDPDTGAPLLSMLVDDAKSQGDAGATIRLRDRMADTQVALQRRLIRPGADPSSAFQPWPLVLGAVYSIEPPLLDYAAQQYAANDGPIAAMGVVRDKGDPFDYSAGDYTYSTTDGTLTLHNGQAQGRITLDISSVGGDQATPPTDLLGGDGDFTSGANWTLGGGAAGNSSIDGGLLTLGDYDWPDVGTQSQGVISWAKYNSITLTAGRTYRIVIKVRRLASAPYTGQPSYDVPARLEVMGGGASPSTYSIPWLSITAKREPYGGWRNYDHSAETFVGYAAPQGTNPALFLVLYGSHYSGDAAVIESIEVNEIGLDDFDDNSLIPITLEAFMREVLEVRAGWTSDQWSAADAAAIDADTGYAGIGLYAASDSSLTVYDALQLAAQSYCASLWIDDAGVLRITRLTAPEDVPAALIDHHIGIADMLDEADISLDMAQNLSSQIGARKNWSPLNGSDLVTDGVALPGSGNPGNASLGIQGDVSFADNGWTWSVDISGKPVAWGDLTGTPITLSGYGITDAATAAQGALADSAVQPGDLGSMASEDDAPSDGTGYVRKDGAWATESGGVDPQPNLIANSNWQAGLDDWTNGRSTFVAATFQDRACAKLTVTATPNGYALVSVDVQPNTKYTLSADVATTDTAFLQLQNKGAGATGVASSSVFATSGNWDRKSATITTDANTTSLACVLYVNTLGSVAYAGRFKLEKSDTPTPYTEEAATQTLADKGSLDVANTWTAQQTFSGGIALSGSTSQYMRGDGSPSTKPAVESTSVQEIIVTSTTPSSSSANSGKLYLVY